MRRMFVVTFVLVLLCAPVRATPEEDMARMQGEIDALKARVSALEQALAEVQRSFAELVGGPPAPPPPETPPAPPETPPAPPPGDVSGTWVLDREAYAAELEKDRLARLRTILDGMVEADRAKALEYLRAKVAQDAKDAMLKVTLRPDGTWTLESGFSGILGTAQGIYEVAGDRLKIHRTHLNGMVAQEDREVPFSAGRIELPPTKTQPVPLSLVRQ